MGPGPALKAFPNFRARQAESSRPGRYWKTVAHLEHFGRSHYSATGEFRIVTQVTTLRDLSHSIQFRLPLTLNLARGQ